MTDAASVTDPIFTDETAAREHFEMIRWPNGPVCPHCGATGETATQLAGKSHRSGLYQCNACRGPFTVKMGSVMESSHLSYRKWALAFHLMASSKKRMSAHQLHRMLGVTYKTAWFLAMRIREAMREINPDQLGGDGKFVEADETFSGGKAKNRAYREPPPKEAVMALVERGGKVRSYHVPEVTAATLKPIIVDAIAKDTHFRTDESGVYWKSARNSPATKRSFIRSANTSVATRTPTRLKVTSQSSSAASMVSITTSASSF